MIRELLKHKTVRPYSFSGMKQNSLGILDAAVAIYFDHPDGQASLQVHWKKKARPELGVVSYEEWQNTHQHQKFKIVMSKLHQYKLTTTWTGNKGTGTSSVSAYERNHTITMDNKPELHLTTDNALYGDRTKLNPEDLLVTAISSCHMMSYLYLCARAGVVIIDYIDNAAGMMLESAAGGGQFTEVMLNPVVTVADDTMVEKAISLHHDAHEICYIASSVNFPVRCKPTCHILKS